MKPNTRVVAASVVNAKALTRKRAHELREPDVCDGLPDMFGLAKRRVRHAEMEARRHKVE
jgi:hypothetical protein